MLRRQSYYGSRPSSRIESIPASSSLRDGTDQPQVLTVKQHRPHLHHVAPRARVSWVSVTDTEEDWVDAGEGGEELDRIFGTGLDLPFLRGGLRPCSAQELRGNTTAILP